MVPTLHIHLLGDFRLVYDDTPVTSIDVPRLQSLLAYLALHASTPQSRMQLAYLLWPDSTDVQARANLRTLVHRLRQTLPHADVFLYADRHALQWQSRAPWTLDVLDFERAFTRANEAEQANDLLVMRQALEEVVALYRGDLLPGCYDEWLIPERDRLRQVFLEALERLIVVQEGERDYRAAVRSAQRLLQHDPLHETTYRHLMRLYAVLDDQASAVRTYHTCVTVLERELATEPSWATREVYERLVQAKKQRGSPAEHRQALMAVTPLVGQKLAWTKLQKEWRDAAAGRPCLVALEGEAGIGKTRLTEELLAWLGRQGIATASARCYATEGELAYAPVSTWLRTAPLQESLSSLADVWLTEVARLLPDLLVQRPELPRPGPLTESWQRQQLFEALVQAVLKGSRPLALFLDDLQWCDRETLEWLHYLLRFDTHAPLLVVGTVRLEEMSNEHPLISLLVYLRHEELVTEIALEPLDAADTASLARYVIGRELDPTMSSNLYQETEGNPLFVVETVRAAALARGKGDTRSVSLASTLPPTLQAVIAARMVQLSPTAREIVGLASVIGRAFTFGVLAQASGSNEATLVRGLDELWQRRIVREQSTGGEGAYAALSRAQRRLLHRHVAEALEVVAANPIYLYSAMDCALASDRSGFGSESTLRGH